jgi:hypothetical protein
MLALNSSPSCPGPIHHLASSPPWPGRGQYKSDGSVVDNSDIEANQTNGDSFQGPGENNEVSFFSQGIIFF